MDEIFLKTLQEHLNKKVQNKELKLKQFSQESEDSDEDQIDQNPSQNSDNSSTYSQNNNQDENQQNAIENQIIDKSRNTNQQEISDKDQLEKLQNEDLQDQESEDLEHQQLLKQATEYLAQFKQNAVTKTPRLQIPESNSTNPFQIFDDKKHQTLFRPTSSMNNMQQTSFTFSQENIIEAFPNEFKLFDSTKDQSDEQGQITGFSLSKLKFRQSIVGFIIGIQKAKQNIPLQIDELCELIQPYYKSLRRREGGRYAQKVHGLVVATLNQHEKLFLKDCRGFWRMNLEEANDFEERCIRQEDDQMDEFAMRYQIKSQRRDSSKSEDTQNISNHLMMANFKKKRDKKSQRELIDKFELTYQKVYSKLQNQYIESDQDPNALEFWQSMSESQRMGFLHAFIVLRPFLQKSLQLHDKVQLAVSLLLKSGIFTRKANGRQRTTPLDGMPIITQSDANKLIELERTLNAMNDRVNSILVNTKNQLEQYGQKLQLQQIPIKIQ